MSEPPTLTDGSVVIRALTPDDARGLHEQATDPLSIAWTNVPDPHTPEMALEFVARAEQRWADGSEWIFAVESTDGDYAGNIALRDEGLGRAEIAYGSHPAARGTGTMEAALRLLLEWGFTRAGVSTVTWRANVGNWASRKLAWRLGFTVDGVLRGTHEFRGSLVDAWVGTLRADEKREPRHPWLDSPVLSGDGVRLRPALETDLERVVEWCTDERTQLWLGTMPWPYTDADARAWMESGREKQATGSGTGWMIADAETDVALGSIGIFDLRAGVDCEVGYVTHPDARGRGVTTTATRVVLGYAFGALGLRRVQAHAALDNAASRHVLEAAGLRESGLARLGTTTRSGPTDAAVYDVMLDEWVASELARARSAAASSAASERR